MVLDASEDQPAGALADSNAEEGPRPAEGNDSSGAEANGASVATSEESVDDATDGNEIEIGGKRKRECFQVIVGCDTDWELEAARKAFTRADLTRLELQFEGSGDAASEVRDQPMNVEEIMEGAKNKAHNTWAKWKLNRVSEARMWVGFQVGMMEVGGKTMELVASAIFDGKFFHTGLSSVFELPRKVASQMVGGSIRRDAFEQAGVPEASAGSGVLGWLSGGQATRMSQIEEAVFMASLPLRHTSMFIRIEGQKKAAGGGEV